MSDPRKHHYVPVLLLQGFTPSGRRDDFLWVHDKEQSKVWRTKPDQAAHERDYYRVDLDEAGIDPNIVEKLFGSTIEAKAATVIQEIGSLRRLPQGDDFLALIEFVTLLALRTPAFRGLYERNMEQLYRHSAKMILSRREPFEQFLQYKRAKGEEIPPGIIYESLRDVAFDDERYSVEIPRTSSVQMLVKLWPDMVPVFLARNWSLLFTRPNEEHLICSDMPVSITPTSPNYPPQFLGFGLPQTELTIPLSRSLALVGSYEAPSVSAEIPLEFVRIINRRTMAFAARFLYSPGESLFA